MTTTEPMTQEDDAHATSLQDPVGVQFHVVDPDDVPTPDVVEWPLRQFAATTNTLTAAADTHDGAMVALIPTTEDALDLVMDGGEPLEELHCTLFFLGPADDVADADRVALLTAIEDLAGRWPVVDGKMFGLAIWNPDTVDRCLIVNVSGGDLEALDDAVAELIDDIEFPLVEQHLPWIPHITLYYGDDVNDVDSLVAGRVGPVTFDRIRVAFGDVTTDIPLTGGDLTA